MDEDEELYREMNEEDPYYMGDPEDNDDNEEYSRPEPQLPPRRKTTASERRLQKKLDIFWTVVSGIVLYAFIWWLIFG